MSKFIVFRINKQDFAIRVEAVQDIHKEFDLTPIPKSKDFIAGMFASRGTVVPVIDLASLFAVQKNPVSQRVIIINHKDELVAFLVDEVLEIVESCDDDIISPSHYLHEIADYIEGIISKEERMIVILRIDAIVSTEVIDISESLKKVKQEENKKKIEILNKEITEKIPPAEEFLQ